MISEEIKATQKRISELLTDAPPVTLQVSAEGAMAVGTMILKACQDPEIPVPVIIVAMLVYSQLMAGLPAEISVLLGRMKLQLAQVQPAWKKTEPTEGGMQAAE